AVFASTERNGTDFDIYTADLETGETSRVFDGTFGYFAQSLSPDGSRLIVTETVGEDSDNLYLLDLTTGELETLSKPSPRANHGDGGFAWLSDSSGFYFSTNKDREFTTLSFYDVSENVIHQIADESRDVWDIVLCGPEQRFLAYIENVDGFDALQVIDRRTNTPTNIPNLPEGSYTLSCAADANLLSVGVNGWKTPGDIYAWNFETADATEVFASNYAGLDPARLVRPESIRIMARDGVELQGLLYLPDGVSSSGDELPPLVFQVHGGPTGQSRATFDPIAQYHVDRGLAVFEPNVRGSLGFGRTYVTLDDRKKRRDSVRDLVDLLEGLRSDGRVDVDRAAVVGGSYGGYMVNAVLALYPGSFKAGVSLFGVSDWVTALQIASPALKASDRIEFGDIREQEWIDFYTENSPIRLANRIDVPVLFSHGEMDPRIDIAETEVMVRALRENGVDAPFIRIPDEGHGWRKLSNRLFYFRRQADFLETELAE
ncbi:MAG: prolyl oligopeptidase family serine peptidase, partial [Pseudomonadota bacterium]